MSAMNDIQKALNVVRRIEQKSELDMLTKYEDESDLNGKSTQYWWAPQTNEGQRRVSMRYGARNVEGTSAYVDNSLASVTAHIKVLRQVVEESDDATWEPEEQRRAKK